MHPVLFRIPLPEWRVPLLPVLVLAAVSGGALALYGRRRGTVDLLVVGVLVAVGASVAAVQQRGMALELDVVPVYSYGVLLCVSLVAGWYLTLELAAKDGLPKVAMANCYFTTVVAAIVGARFLYVLTAPDAGGDVGDVFAFRRGGLVAYGGFLGGFAGSWAFLSYRRLRLLPWVDVAAPSLALGLVFTRIGCYLFGCDYGRPLSADAPGWLRAWGTFPRWPDGTVSGAEGSPAWVEHVNAHGLAFDASASLPVHPTQLYESVAGLALLGLVMFVRGRQRFRGEVFLALVFGYGIVRFGIEIFRGDPERGAYGPYVAEHWLVPLALGAFAAAYCLGPSRSVRPVVGRRAGELLSIAPAVAAYAMLRPAAGADPVVTQLSTSQWLAVGSAVAAAGAWARLDRRARRHPDRAMELGLPEHAAEGAAGGPDQQSDSTSVKSG